MVILANLPVRLLRTLWQEEEPEIAATSLGDSWEGFRASLKKIRAAGVWVTRGELDKGMIGIAAPIWQPDRQIVGSVGIVVPEASTSPEEVAGTSALVQAAAREIDAGLLEAHGAIARE